MVASWEKFVVFEMAESVCPWKPACILTCHSGRMSWEVTKTRWISLGTPSKWMWPSVAIRSMSSSEYHPWALAMRTKSGLTSGMREPACFRMKATAKRGSIPPEHPAKMEMVPVGATVVRLQFLNRRSGRIRSPSGLRAQDWPGPQMDRSHSGKTPRTSASRSEAIRASSFRKPITRWPISTPSGLS